MVEKIFGIIPKFKSKDEMLEEERDLSRLRKYKQQKVISKFFIAEGYRVIIENGILCTDPKLKKSKKTNVRFISTAMETKRSKH